MIILFEGLDGAGKDTLHRAFQELTNHRYLGMVRSFPSMVALARYYRRPDWWVQSYLHDGRIFFKEFEHLLVMVVASPACIARRLAKRREKINSSSHKILGLLQQAASELGVQHTWVADTTRASTSNLAQQLLSEVQAITREKNQCKN